jgi:Flp pilus assembly pilin Flp
MQFAYGLGTWLIGFVSDLPAPAAGAAAIEYALLTVMPAAAILAPIQFRRAGNALATDLPRAAASQSGVARLLEDRA